MAVSADVARLAAAAPEYARAMSEHQRRNFLFLMLDGATFAFAISLLSETTIIPAFIQQLSGSSVLVGLVAATFAIGRYLPQLIGAHLVRGRSRRKPMLLTIVIAERVGILAIAGTAQLIGAVDTGVVLGLFFLAFCAYAVTTGLIGPVYGDFVAKALTRGRGWFYGSVQLLGGVLGFSAALVAENIIRTNEFPQGIQLCFWICFGLSFLSIFFIAGLREVPYPHVEPRPRLLTTIREIPSLISGDRVYGRFVTARAFLAFSTFGVGFVVVDGIDRGLRTSDAALLAAVFILSQAVLGFLLGLIGNYFGWRIVVILGGVLIAAGMAGAVVAEALPAYIAIFAALGGANAVTVIGDPNMSIELAPAEKTSLYLGTTSTLLAPFFILGPLAAGALVVPLGYPPVFTGAAVFAVVGIVLALRVREPRKSTVPSAVGQPGALP
ncbi:MAG TPA: MFS transporter [Terrimesophilobacter sp.]|uniref:MFS transporter n=1 Tax=Terrimesophilobacter sp. TaxID=2906435 RepID=UPI002F951CED